jgi:hypothetical protein
MKKQANQYDKIFKENIEAVIPSLMQKVLSINAVLVEDLPNDVQHTKERKPDVLKKITDQNGSIFVLHIEFQVGNESEMIYRMGEYYFMLARKYKLPIQQFVIFIGSSKPRMTTKIDFPLLKFEFPLISLANIDYNLFLNSNKPEEVILSILADFNNISTDSALKLIISRLEETTQSDLSLKKYFKQLRILAQLRKLEQNLKNIVMDSIAKYIDEEKDVAFLVGLDKGELKAEERFVKNLLAKMTLTLEQIADIAGVSVEFVKQVKQKITVH